MARGKPIVKPTTDPRDQKLTNPKEAFGSAKTPLDLVPDTIEMEVALAYLEGALKYGRYNWRVAGVRASIYRAAVRRHIAAWWNGEDADPDTQVKHLANAIACLGIILDAALCDKLNDDRPPKVDVGKRFKEQMAVVAHLKQLFKDHSPPQYTEREHGRDGMQAQRNAVHALMSVPAGTSRRRTRGIQGSGK